MFQVNPILQTLLLATDDEAWVKLHFNGVELYLPVGTIITMAHCLTLTESVPVLNVETAHLDWMRSHLVPGATFLDVGASTGAMTLPIAKQFPAIQIIAFEPASRARRLLKATLLKNDLSGVKIEESAVSDREGVTRFAEYAISEDGSIPFLPEASTIITGGDLSHPGEIAEVRSVTLNSVAQAYGLRDRNLVIKLDIEGYEVEALRGASDIFQRNSTSIAIDIHGTPGNPAVSTESACREIIGSYGYAQFEMRGHVLLCTK